jgi:hypothetical protein
LITVSPAGEELVPKRRQPRAGGFVAELRRRGEQAERASSSVVEASVGLFDLCVDRVDLSLRRLARSGVGRRRRFESRKRVARPLEHRDVRGEQRVLVDEHARLVGLEQLMDDLFEGVVRQRPNVHGANGSERRERA